MVGSPVYCILNLYVILTTCVSQVIGHWSPAAICICGERWSYHQAYKYVYYYFDYINDHKSKICLCSAIAPSGEPANQTALLTSVPIPAPLSVTTTLQAQMPPPISLFTGMPPPASGSALANRESSRLCNLPQNQPSGSSQIRAYPSSATNAPKPCTISVLFWPNVVCSIYSFKFLVLHITYL